MRASKRDKAKILDEVMSTTGMGRSTARRMLSGQVLPDPAEQVDAVAGHQYDQTITVAT